MIGSFPRARLECCGEICFRGEPRRDDAGEHCRKQCGPDRDQQRARIAEQREGVTLRQELPAECLAAGLRDEDA